MVSLDKVKMSIDEIDPMGLLSFDCPKDEYINEARLLSMLIVDSLDKKLVYDIFYRQFYAKLSNEMLDELTNLIANNLNVNVISNISDKIMIRIHERFIVKYKDNKIFINDKFYKKVKYNNLFNVLIDLVNNEDIIYIQYSHKRFKFFKTYNKNKYNYDIVKRKYDIEMVFDNKELLDYSGLKDLKVDEIIDVMFKSKIDINYEKLYYSKDKKQRLIVYKNTLGSYSYYVEILSIVEPEERMWYGNYAYWHPLTSESYSLSLYDSLDNLLKDINYLLVDMEEIYESYN